MTCIFKIFVCKLGQFISVYCNSQFAYFRVTGVACKYKTQVGADTRWIWKLREASQIFKQMDVLKFVTCLTVRLSTDIHSSLCISITALHLLHLKILDLLSQICLMILKFKQQSSFLGKKYKCQFLKQLRVKPATTNMKLNQSWPTKQVAHVLLTPVFLQVLALA